LDATTVPVIAELLCAQDGQPQHVAPLSEAQGDSVLRRAGPACGNLNAPDRPSLGEPLTKF
jgi:hypothetical protein